MEAIFVTIKPLLLGLVLAFLVESFVEYIFGQALDHLPKLAPLKWLLQYVALVAGAGLSYYYYIDVIAVITDTQTTLVGVILTGLGIGRGANYFHQFVSTYFPKRE
jgi:hypothetical protein